MIEYSDNYFDTSGSLWQFKRDEIEGNVDLTVDDNHIPNNSSSFKYKSSFITNRNGVKIAAPLKYLSNFWRSLEMPLINCKVKLRNAFNNNIPTDLKLSKAQTCKIIQSGEFLGSLLSKLACPLMKLAIPLAKNILTPLGITAAASAIDAETQKKIQGSGTTTLIISNKEINEIIKIAQALEDSNILLKGVTKTIKNETKEQREGFLSTFYVL